MEQEREQSIDNDFDSFKNELNQFCEEHHLTKFEPDEIIELLEDGEEIDWIVEQLLPPDDTQKIETLKSILSPIQAIVYTTSEEDDIESLPEVEEGVEIEEEIPLEEAPEDKAFDLSALADLGLPEGMGLPPGFDMKQVQEIMASPTGQFMADFATFCQEKGIDTTNLETAVQNNISDLQQEWMATPREAFEGKTPQQMVDENPELILPQKVETYRREQPKVGRNDPCPCGSGKKYKKCCGRGM